MANAATTLSWPVMSAVRNGEDMGRASGCNSLLCGFGAYAIQCAQRDLERATERPGGIEDSVSL